MAITQGLRTRVRLIGWSLLLSLAVVADLGVGLVLLLSTTCRARGVTERALGWLRWLADPHRLWTGSVMGRPIARPYRNTPTRRADPASWRDVRWLVTDSTLGLLLVALPALCVLFCLVGLGAAIDAGHSRMTYILNNGEVIADVAPDRDGPALHQALLRHQPDIAVVDVRLPPTFTDEGLRASIAVRKRLPGLPTAPAPSDSSSRA